MSQVPPPPYPSDPQAKYGPPSQSNTKWIWIVVGVLVFGCVILPIFAAILFPVLSKVRGFPSARQAAKRAECLSNIKQIATGMLLYSTDYDDTLPPGPGWQSKIQPMLSSKEVLHCPVTRSLSGFGYAYNQDVVGANLNKFKDPFKVPMIFESNMTFPDAVAKYEISNFATRHHFKGKTQFSVAYLDSSAKMVDLSP